MKKEIPSGKCTGWKVNRGHVKDHQKQIELIDEKIGILENDQQPEIDDHGQCDRQPRRHIPRRVPEATGRVRS